MTLQHIILLAVVQGITEFLPISSSGHLVLTPAITGTADQGLLLDVSVHVGTLLAVLIYFWRDVLAMIIGFFRLFTGRMTPGARMALHIVVATIPVVAVGFYLKESGIEEQMRSVEIIAWTTLVFGIILWVADRVGMTINRIEHMGWAGSIFIGLAQVIALVPGVSRSGITMTAARLMSYERSDAAQFSMLMSIPVILGAGLLAGLDLHKAGNMELNREVMMAIGFSFITALITIAVLMSWLKRASFTPFAIYRILLGAALLVWVYGYGTAPLDTLF
ncbi:undecaprenyl-diphosphate phosphatase [Thalassospira marina]|uniref:Undecaprenyl-diphosphatase n=1 Tax=Thalassospira marina TaxID=2048283 RepID=A0A2N3KUD3_9PROT|nr:undecaprenyl-diphosphate phosphatase [Thalassospira marina]AUG54238.1 undecaprenyl-diphosphate phosphatase [Thalassospira marina]PKR54155.1 undecaprenyl-diphosphate phosphatase [Thalassospira marina]